MSSISHRISRLIGYKGMSIRAFESQAGITQGVLSNAIKKNSDISSGNLSKIIDTYAEFNAHWLLTGDGEMLINDQTVNDTPIAEISDTAHRKPKERCTKEDYELPSTDEFEYTNNDNNGKVPILSEFNFAIADPDEPSKVNAEDYYYIKEFRNADFMLRVSGDYMSPKYRSGDLVACRHDRYNTFYQWGRVYALLTCSLGLVIGRVYEHHQNTIFVIVKPENPAYPEWEIPIDEIAKSALIIGSISFD